MRAVILARVSTEDQREAGNSLPAQITRIEAYCKRNGFEVANQHSFDESAYKERRDQFDKILEKLNKSKNVMAVCFDKVDRFSRNVFDVRVATLYDMAINGKIELHFVSDGLVIHKDISAAEKFQFSVSLGLAKYYSDAISDNVKRAFEEKRRNGEWTGKAPLGYMNIKTDDEKSDIIPDPQTSHIIVEMFELYAAGKGSIRTLQDRAYDMGLRGRTGKKAGSSMIAHLLNNPFYHGVARLPSTGYEYPHRYQPLISKDLFDQCQARMKGWSKKRFKYAAKPFALRGLVRCSKCGCALSPDAKKGGKYVYYACTNARKDICNKKIHVREEELLEPISGIFEAFDAIPQSTIDGLIDALKKTHEAKTEFHNREISRLQTEYNTQQARQDKLMDLLLDGSITKADYDNKCKQIKERQHNINIELEEYTNADESYIISATMVLNLAKNALTLFESSKPEEKREILGYVLSNSVFDGEKLIPELKKPFDSIAESARQALAMKSKKRAFDPLCPIWLRD
ncbi:recombinase family protein [Patescibacteria group bacterium]|nr:recombinase family protein [Patescibacteria group bacterium]MBU1915658.1 recombinase family protein [Patescibacteria group bacterium]